MTTAVATPVAPFGAITTYRLVNSVERVIQAITTWNATRVTRIALTSLSDEMLNDIGLSRGDINKVAPGFGSALR